MLNVTAILIQTHGNMQWCFGTIYTANAAFHVKPKKGYRKKEFWENLKKINGLC